MGCNEDKNKIPADIIELHQMAALLTDIHIVDGSLMTVPQAPDSIAKHGLGLYLAVIKAHNTDTATFKKSLKFYSLRPDLMTAMYIGIENRLTKRLDSLNKIKPKERPINKDSINKVKLQHSADSIKAVNARVKSDSATAVKALKRGVYLKNKKLNKRNALPKQ